MGGVLVTGAGGFVGANLVRRLRAAGREVHAVVRPGSDGRRLDGQAVSQVDLLDAEAVRALLARTQPEAVLHLAAHGAYSWQQDVATVLQTNAVASATLMEASAAAGVEVLVHAGSSSEYGYVDHPPREDELPRPNSPYAVGKLAATQYGEYLNAKGDLRVVTLRLYSVYGPWEEPRRLIPALVSHALRGELPPLVDPATARDFVFVGDVCGAFELAIEGGAAGVFNVCSGRQVTLGELVALVREVFEVAVEPSWGTMEARRWDTTTWVGDPAKAQRELGWVAGTPLTEGLLATAAQLNARI